MSAHTHALSLSTCLGTARSLVRLGRCVVVVLVLSWLLLLFFGLLFPLGVRCCCCCCCCGCCVRVLVVVGGCCCRGCLLAICVLAFTRRSTSSCLVGQSDNSIVFSATIHLLVSTPFYRPRLSRVLEPSSLPLIITRFIHGPPINLGYGAPEG
jgi:hypothetical protein